MEDALQRGLLPWEVTPQHLQGCRVCEGLYKALFTLGIIIRGAVYFIRKSYYYEFPLRPTHHFGLHKNVIHREV